MNGHHHLLSILIDRNKTRPETKDKMLTVPIKTITRATMAIGEFEPGKVQYSTQNFFDRLFLIGAY